MLLYFLSGFIIGLIVGGVMMCIYMTAKDVPDEPWGS